MFKLIRNVNSILNGIKYSRIADNSLAPRSSIYQGILERSMNSLQLLGRVGADPEQKGSEANPVVMFSVATHTNYKTDKGDWIQRIDWHQIAVFNTDLRESVLNHMSKGQRVLINGTITYGEVKDSKRVTRPVTSIIADEIVFLQ